MTAAEHILRVELALEAMWEAYHAWRADPADPTTGEAQQRTSRELMFAIRRAHAAGVSDLDLGVSLRTTEGAASEWRQVLCERGGESCE